MSIVQSVLMDAEKGACKVFLSVINLGEVLYIIEREKGMAPAQEVLAAIEQLPIDILSAPRETVLEAAHIKANYPMAYADAFTVAAALAQHGSIITGDPEFKSVDALVKIEWI
jgi:ribonuclease VapC